MHSSAMYVNGLCFTAKSEVCPLVDELEAFRRKLETNPDRLDDAVRWALSAEIGL